MGVLISRMCVHYACTVSQEGNRASDHLQLELYTVGVAMSVGAGRQWTLGLLEEDPVLRTAEHSLQTPLLATS